MNLALTGQVRHSTSTRVQLYVLGCALVVLPIVAFSTTMPNPLGSLALGGMVVAALASSRWRQTAVLVGLGLYYFSLSIFLRAPGPNGANTAAAQPILDPRFLVVGCIALLAVTHRISPGDRAQLALRPAARALGALLMYGALSWFWSHGRGDTMLWAGGMGLAMLFIFLSLQRLPPATVERSLKLFCGALMVGCVVFTLFVPSAFIGGGLRSAGLFGNPNSLGLFVVLALPILLKNNRRGLLFVLIAVFLVYRSGSRASGIALALELLYLAYTALPRKSLGVTVLAMTPVLAVSLVLVAHSELQNADTTSNNDPGSIVRTSDSRFDTWRQVRTQIGSAPFFGVGVGAGAGEIEIGSSYLQILFEGGLVGAAAGMVVILTLGRIAIRGGRFGVAMLMGALANATFESWLFAGGSLFFLLLWMAVIVMARSESGATASPRNGRTRTAPASALPA